MNKLKILFLTFSVLLAGLAAQAQTNEGSVTVKVNGTATISLGSTYSRVLRNNATGINYRWYSSNTSVASVTYSSYNSCTVSGKVNGTCKIYFHASFYIDGYYRTYDFYWDVTVSGYTGGSTTVVNPTSAVLYPTELTLEVGQTYDLSFDVYPTNATYTYEWVSYSNIVTVNSQGRVTAVSPGSAYVYLWIYDSQGGCNLVPTCKVTIVQPSRVYDEDATAAPLAVNNANVTVNRTLTANKWNTICLPFALSDAQVTAAFGNDVELADFTGYDVDYDAGNNVVGINVNFCDVTAMEANHPYIIKVKEELTSFSVDGVNVVPTENPAVEHTNDITGTYGTFVGAYVAETVVPQNCLFISDNRFWYSSGKTKMKAFRAYLNLQDVLTDIGSQQQSARIMIVVNNETAGVLETVSLGQNNRICHDLQGRRVSALTKGLYINNGRIIIK